jgi:hypothetical protein
METQMTNGHSQTGMVVPQSEIAPAPLEGELSTESERRARLEWLERQFREGFRAQIRALTEIKERELFRLHGYSDFAAYCKGRLDVGRSRAYQLLDFSEAIEALGESPLVEKITSEAQIRPLAGMKVEAKVRVLERAAKVAEQQKQPMTGKLVEDVARKNFHWKSRSEFKAERKKLELEQDPEARRKAVLAAFSKAAEAIMQLGEPEDLAREFGEPQQWTSFLPLYEWLKRAQEVG